MFGCVTVYCCDLHIVSSHCELIHLRLVLKLFANYAQILEHRTASVPARYISCASVLSVLKWRLAPECKA
eukprot:2658226-Amphidinium_carterae.3